MTVDLTKVIVIIAPKDVALTKSRTECVSPSAKTTHVRMMDPTVKLRNYILI